MDLYKTFNSWYNPGTDKAESLDTLVQKLESGKVGKLEKKCIELSEKEKSDVLMEYRLCLSQRKRLAELRPQMGNRFGK